MTQVPTYDLVHQQMDATDELLTTAGAAKVLQVSVQTVRRWETNGDLLAVRTPGKQRRFRRSDVEALLAPKEAAS